MSSIFMHIQNLENFIISDILQIFIFIWYFYFLIRFTLLFYFLEIEEEEAVDHLASFFYIK